MKSVAILSIICLSLFLFGCHKNPLSDSQKNKDSNFSSPEEYVQNPSIANAMSKSGINTELGNNPPPLIGDYNTNGEVTNAASLFQGLIGGQINDLITLYNQTNTGKISFREEVQNTTAWATGGYVTGKSGNFTIWQESTQSGSEAGLPAGITIHVALIMSGTKLSNGNLNAEGLSVITKVENNNSNYDTSNLKGNWWMWQANFSLAGAPSL